MKLISLTLLLWAADPGISSPSAVDAIVEEARKTWQVPGCAVVILKKDQLVVLKGYGRKSHDRPEAVTPDTIFSIGSLTKAMTAASLALLVEEGKLDWDDPVRKHVSGFRLADPLADREVTVRDLLAHRTGLARHDLLWYRAPWALEEAVARLAHLQPAHSFRSRYEYNNLSYITLGLAIQSISKESWQQFLGKRLLEPLGMNQVVFTRAQALAAPDHATPHQVSVTGECRVIDWYDDDQQIRASGSVKASARDMTQWMRFQLGKGTWQGKRLLSEKNFREMHRPQIVMPVEERQMVEAETTQASYGLGWRIQDYRGHLLLRHGGATDGFRAAIFLAPREQTGVLILTNAAVDLMPDALGLTLLDWALGLPPKNWNKLYQEQRTRQRENDRKAEAKRQSSRQKDTQPSRPLDAYAGVYVHPAYGELRILTQQDGLMLHWSSFRNRLSHFHFDSFEVPEPGRLYQENVLFELDTDGNPARLRFLNQTFTRKSKRD